MEGNAGKRLILVSNRLPYKVLERNGKVVLKRSDGGLVTALASYCEREASEFEERLWIGAADFSEKRWEKLQEGESARDETFSVEPIFIPSRSYDKYYNGFCNTLIWPLFHYFSTYVIYNDDNFAAYEEVNRMFAEKILSILKPSDVLWIHDYHHLLLPQMIREARPDADIGFFLHIPFPSYEIFRTIHRSWKEKIINGMLGADLIGFHTHEYVQHFLKSVRMVTGYDHQYRSVNVGERIAKVDMFPLGIDFDKFHGALKEPKIVKQREEIRKNFGDMKIIFSVDRLDYTKGVTHRLAGFERFLQKYSDWHEKVVFIMGVVPSRHIISKYNERKKLIEEQVGGINGRYSTLRWQPVIYRYSHIPFEELSALYQVADVALITPLRDGMNLVAKEYVASQEQDGVLILSELAGAASELGEALLVNPTDPGEMAEAIERALVMPVEEQREKIKLMQERLVDYNVVNWVTDFLSQLGTVKPEQGEQIKKILNKNVMADLAERFRNAGSRHLFLDYDGTLVPFAKRPQDARPGEEVATLLKNLTEDDDTVVTIISGRDAAILETWFENQKVNLVAEHGASVRLRGGQWRNEVGAADDAWKQMIRPTLELFVKRSPGAFLEEKNHTLAWHYRNVQHELGFVRSRELLDSLSHLVSNAELQVIDGNKVIEVRVTGIDKGTAAKKLMEEIPSEFVVAIGDDRTDEDMFKKLADTAITVKVGHGHTQAQYLIPSQREVLEFLKQFTSHAYTSI